MIEKQRKFFGKKEIYDLVTESTISLKEGRRMCKVIEKDDFDCQILLSSSGYYVYKRKLTPEEVKKKQEREQRRKEWIKKKQRQRQREEE